MSLRIRSPMAIKCLAACAVVFLPGLLGTICNPAATISGSGIKLRAAGGIPPFILLRQLPDYTVRLKRIGLYLTRPGDSFERIARLCGVDHEDLIGANPSYDPKQLPVGVAVHLPSKPAMHAEGPRFIWPVIGRITSRYGWRWGRLHEGVDIAAHKGMLVRAAAEGRVVFSGWRSGYGLLVILLHPQGWRTAYAHNSRLLVHRGQWAAAGQALARAGATGFATGVHVHFEISSTKGRIDPLKMLKQ